MRVLSFLVLSLVSVAVADPTLMTNVVAVRSPGAKGPTLTLAARGPSNALFVCELGASPNDPRGPWAPIGENHGTSGCWERVPLSRLTSHPTASTTIGGRTLVLARGDGNRLHGAVQNVVQDSLPSTARRARWSSWAPLGGPLRLGSLVSSGTVTLGETDRVMAVALDETGNVVFTVQRNPGKDPLSFAPWSELAKAPSPARDAPVLVTPNEAHVTARRYGGKIARAAAKGKAHSPFAAVVVIVGEDLEVYTNTLRPSTGSDPLSWAGWTRVNTDDDSDGSDEADDDDDIETEGSSRRGKGGFIASVSAVATSGHRLQFAGFTPSNRPVQAWQRVPGSPYFSRWAGFGSAGTSSLGYSASEARRFAAEVSGLRAASRARDTLSAHVRMHTGKRSRGDAVVTAALADSTASSTSSEENDKNGKNVKNGKNAAAAAAAAASGGPLAAVTGVTLAEDPRSGLVYAAARLRDATVAVRRQSFSSGWTPWASMGGHVRRDPFVVGERGGGVHVVAVGLNGVVVHRLVGGTHGWTTLPGITCD